MFGYSLLVGLIKGYISTMVKLRALKDTKKFKGKKKVSNALEKKAKGLKLNQIDRKRIVKLEEKKQFKEQLKKNVKAELEKFQAASNGNEDDAQDSLCSESSFGSQPGKINPKKRVSFSGNMERVKVFDKNIKDLDIKPSSASPGKGILRAKLKREKKLAVEKKVRSGSENKAKNGDIENLDAYSLDAAPSAKKKIKIQVTKKVKEQLLNMPRKERKAFLKELKAKKNPISERAMECKLLWEKIRSSKTSKIEKDDCVSKLVGLVKGYASKLIYPHDTCRVIECLLALRRPGITTLLFDELTPEIVRMTKSVYARFFVQRMLKYGTKQQRDIIIGAFRNHAISLIRIVHAAEVSFVDELKYSNLYIYIFVLETAYNEYANAQQRFDIISEFYGREFVIFRADRPRTLDEIISEEPAKKKLIVQHIEELIFTIIEKYIFKLMVKNFKDLSVKAAMEHYGHRVLQAIFDTVDDTVLVNKYIVTELGNEIRKLILDPWGEKVIHYLVHPRDGRGMEKSEIIMLQEGDSNPFSKKEKKDRYSELYKGISEALYLFVAANMEELIFEHNKPKLVAGCLETTSQYDLFDRRVPSDLRRQCNQAIVDIAKQEFIPMDSERFHLIEHPAGSFVLLGALRCDKNLPENEQLSVMLVQELTSEQIGSWIACNKRIMESINVKRVKQYTFKGALLLIDEMKKE
uniref:CPL domain-containing protein n=1 Tax=Heterorhabditis bacteriophora TaxID=37862 RepID=A0A1I7WZH0_HETBA